METVKNNTTEMDRVKKIMVYVNRNGTISNIDNRTGFFKRITRRTDRFTFFMWRRKGVRITRYFRNSLQDLDHKIRVRINMKKRDK